MYWTGCAVYYSTSYQKIVHQPNSTSNAVSCASQSNYALTPVSKVLSDLS